MIILVICRDQTVRSVRGSGTPSRDRHLLMLRGTGAWIGKGGEQPTVPIPDFRKILSVYFWCWFDTLPPMKIRLGRRWTARVSCPTKLLGQGYSRQSCAAVPLRFWPHSVSASALRRSHTSHPNTTCKFVLIRDRYSRARKAQVNHDHDHMFVYMSLSLPHHVISA